jgi:hypothetical protein
MTTHAQAKQILESAFPEILPADSLLVRIIGALESHYGDGWKGTPGEGSNNWGAVQAGKGWKGKTFGWEDSKWNPKTRKQEKYKIRFRAYASPEAAAIDLYKVLTGDRHGESSRLAHAGRWADISHAIGPNGSYYYGGFGPPAKAEADHRKRFLELLREIQLATGERVAPMPAGPGVSKPVGWAILAGLILLGETFGQRRHY